MKAAYYDDVEHCSWMLTCYLSTFDVVLFSPLQVHIDNRGMNWQVDSCTYNGTYTGMLVQQLFDVDYKNAPYSTTFPAIVDTLNYHPCLPVNITISGNAFCNSNRFVDVTTNQTLSWFDTVSSNVNITDC